MSGQKEYHCRCSTQQTEFTCPGGAHCGYHCARSQTKMWGKDDLDAVIAKSNEIGLPGYKGPASGAPTVDRPRMGGALRVSLTDGKEHHVIVA